jgi:hypothetical protein
VDDRGGGSPVSGIELESKEGAQMMETDARQREMLIVGLLGAVVLALLAHLFVPRYEWRVVQGTGSVSVMTYDKWTGSFQRAVYDDRGSLNVMGPYLPSK